MTNDKLETEKQILTMQRDLMSSIMDFQIKYGVESVSWNVNIQFTRGINK